MFFSLNGVTIIIYIDGILVLADTSKDCIKDFQFVMDTLIKLGFHIKREKCILQLNQHFCISVPRSCAGTSQPAPG